MIEKMKFLSITGPKNDIDRVCDTYFTKYEIHLENALTELSTVNNLKPFVQHNPYKESMEQLKDLSKYLNEKDFQPSDQKMTTQEASSFITDLHNSIKELETNIKQEKEHLSHLMDLARQIGPFRQLNYDVKKILEFKFIKFRFGRIAHESYTNLSKYIYENLTTIFFECDSDQDFVWGIYFVPAASSVKVDAIYSSMHFERLFLPNEYEGTPEQSYLMIQSKIKECETRLQDIKDNIQNKFNTVKEDFILAKQILERMMKTYDVRKLAACTNDTSHTGIKKDDNMIFYILCGWMPKKDSVAFLKEIEKDSNVYCISELEHGQTDSPPPTKLKNPAIVKPFETFIKMYGLPAYNELDPTIFLALTYSFMFGMMFGDAGQGLCLFLGGLLLYKIKKINLAAILSCAGFFSTIFGFLYGSLFGYEDIIPTLWVNPMKSTMTVLYTAIGFGVALILIAMIMNIINGIKAQDKEKIFFDTNGIAGLIFYTAAIVCVLLIFTGHSLPAGIILAIFFGIPLLLIFLKEPLTRMLERKKTLIEGNKGMFFLESFFELFEVLLSYITNTVSFVRVGAFALSHAGMMEVILMLGKATEENPSFPIIILGNIFVACLEGLIVGIQVLRLEYYEMFSRFYQGTGKEFKPFKNI